MLLTIRILAMVRVLNARLVLIFSDSLLAGGSWLQDPQRRFVHEGLMHLVTQCGASGDCVMGFVVGSLLVLAKVRVR